MDEADEKEREMERCWKEEHKGASREWLIRDASFKLPKERPCSTMKDTYRYPDGEAESAKNVGRKTAALLQKFYEDAAQEIMMERQPCPEPENRCTEYDGNFRIPGFQPDDGFYTKNKELHEKYPLYSSHPASFWRQKLEDNAGEKMHGLSKITDRKSPFKRCTEFSKPISEAYDVPFY